MHAALRTELISLNGAPAAVGRAYGRAAAVSIRRDVAAFRDAVAASDLAPGEIERRVDHYRAIVDRVAPYWPEEMAAIAAGAGVAEGDYTAHVAQKYVLKATRSAPAPPSHECTSFLATGAATADGISILHKNRDSAPRPQGLWVRAISGIYRYLAGGDASDHGVIHFVNEHGLAGAMNAGSPNDDTVAEGLPTPQVLRLIAEKATTCEEALAILEEIVGRGWYTNGPSGSLWLFVEPARGLVVENTFRHIDHVWIENDVHARANDFFLPNTLPFTRPDALTNTRYLAARRGVERVRGHVTAADFNWLSRDTASEPQRICGDSTLSGFTAVVGGELPALLSMAWVALGHPNNALHVPFFVGAEGTPAFVMDGTLWELSARLHAANPRGPHPDLDIAGYEEDVERDVAAVRAEVSHLGLAGRTAEAVARLTVVSSDWAVRAAAQLDLAACAAPRTA
ncbi:MAG: C45 family autoproteolytic acyltransferase/hydrolase [Thermomicrobiales bacterium]